jgi:hypothetical protein
VRDLLALTAFIAILATIFNAPPSALWRFGIAENLVMVFAAFGIQSSRSRVWLQCRLLKPQNRWMFPVACFLLLAWAMFQMCLAAHSALG